MEHVNPEVEHHRRIQLRDKFIAGMNADDPLDILPPRRYRLEIRMGEGDPVIPASWMIREPREW